MVRGGTPEIASYKETVEAMAPMLVSGGAVSKEEMNFLVGLYDDPGFEQVTEIQFAAWGRRP